MAHHPARRLGGLQPEPRAREAAGRAALTRRDQAEALALAAAGLALWQEGRLGEAEPRYRAAVERADPGDERTADIHSEYGGLLAALHQHAEAARQLERALQIELKGTKDESSPLLVKARYVLGEQYLRMGEAESARRVVAPSLAAAERPLGWLVEAEALFLCGGTEAARAAGERALALAADAEQKERLRERLAPLWDEEGGAQARRLVPEP